MFAPLRYIEIDLKKQEKSTTYSVKSTQKWCVFVFQGAAGAPGLPGPRGKPGPPVCLCECV